MRDGSVVRYAGRRGVVWRLRYRDADGRRVSETLGAERDGWTESKAKEALRERLVDVKREGRRKLEPMRFETFALDWLDKYPDRKDLKRSTREGYETIIRKHLISELGHLPLSAIGGQELNGYLRRKGKTLGPRTLNRHLNLLHALFKAAQAAELVRSNPVSAIERPREPRRRWTILSPVEIGRVERAFLELAAEAETALERAWIKQARVVFLTVVSAGLRRGEVLGLRWRDVSLADPAGATLRVRETWVRNQPDTPKSEKSERTIALGRLAGELFEHRGRSAFQGDDERVFCHPATGGPLDHARYAATFRQALERAKVDRPMRPFHDGRHTSITNGAAAGLSPAALMARAGHSDFKTTELYIDLAGVTFREEAELHDARVFGSVGQKSSQNQGEALPIE
jgi:integrase